MPGCMASCAIELLVGDSAGGNLAASVSILARDRSGPRRSLQVLLYPMVMYQRKAGAHSQSFEQNRQDYFLTIRTSNSIFYRLHRCQIHECWWLGHKTCQTCQLQPLLLVSMTFCGTKTKHMQKACRQQALLYNTRGMQDRSILFSGLL